MAAYLAWQAIHDVQQHLQSNWYTESLGHSRMLVRGKQRTGYV